MSKRGQSVPVCCHICKLEHPPLSNKKVQPVRSVKSKGSTDANAVINWIKCDVCKSWCHIECGGLTSKDYKRLTLGEQYYKCLPCCIKGSCCIKDVQYKTVVSEAVDHLNKTDQSSSQEVTTNSQSDNTASTDQALRDTSVPSEQISADVDTERSNIIVVDDISNPANFVRSDSILQEVKNFAPSIQVKYAYSLAKGGVAIHLNNVNDKVTLLQCFTREAFGGAKISDLATKDNIVFLKNMPTYVDVDTVKSALHDNGIEVKGVQRLQYRITGRPRPVIRVACSRTDAKKLLDLPEFIVGSHTCDVVRKNAHILRCYNCQQFGHIARSCKNQKRCINCSDYHGGDSYCMRQARCANCQGPHRASDKLCPIYQERYAILTSQLKEPEYLKKFARSDCINTSFRNPVVTRSVVTEGQYKSEGLSPSTD